MNPDECKYCEGSGVCNTCKGGNYVSFPDSPRVEYVKGCMNCSYTGRCKCRTGPARSRGADGDSGQVPDTVTPS